MESPGKGGDHFRDLNEEINDETEVEKTETNHIINEVEVPRKHSVISKEIHRGRVSGSESRSRGIPLPDSISLSNPALSRLLTDYGLGNDDVKLSEMERDEMIIPKENLDGEFPVRCSRGYTPKDYRGNWSCAALCDEDILFSSDDKRIISLWTITWSALSLTFSAFTCITCLLIDSSRLQYPERPAVYISLSSFLVALIHLVVALLPRGTISCSAGSFTPARPKFEPGTLSLEPIFEPRAFSPGSNMDRSIVPPAILIRDGYVTDNIGCSLVSVLLYYFTMTCATWWVMLTSAWFLAAVRKWGREAVQGYAGHLHAAAWSLPALQTAILLGLGMGIEGDELTGVCSVGAQNSITLFSFLIAPLVVYFAMGTVLMVAGFLALCSVRLRLKRAQSACAAPPTVQPIRASSYLIGRVAPPTVQPIRASSSLIGRIAPPTSANSQPITSYVSDVRKLERLMIKISLFSLFYISSQACVIGCFIYEQLHKDDWLKTSVSRSCSLSHHTLGQGQNCHTHKSIPPVQVFAVRLAGTLLIGVASIVWAGSGKSFEAWKKFVCRRWVKAGRRDVIYELSQSHPIPFHRPGYQDRVKVSSERADSKSSLYATLNSARSRSMDRVY